MNIWAIFADSIVFQKLKAITTGITGTSNYGAADEAFAINYLFDKIRPLIFMKDLNGGKIKTTLPEAETLLGDEYTYSAELDYDSDFFFPNTDDCKLTLEEYNRISNMEFIFYGSYSYSSDNLNSVNDTYTKLNLDHNVDLPPFYYYDEFGVKHNLSGAPASNIHNYYGVGGVLIYIEKISPTVTRVSYTSPVHTSISYYQAGASYTGVMAKTVNSETKEISYSKGLFFFTAGGYYY